MTMQAGPVKLRDVAKAAGVSQGTASNVFNRPDVVREEVRERVHAAAKALGYAGPSLTGRLLRQRSRGGNGNKTEGEEERTRGVRHDG